MERRPNLSFTGSRYTFGEPFRVLGPPYDERVPYCFLHIPKTAGTTVHFVLMAAFAAGRAEYKRFRVPRVEGDSPISIKPGWDGSWPTVLESTGRYATPGNRRFFSAHCAYGFHEPLGLTGARYFALVRDPIERELSSFNFRYQRGFLSDDATVDRLLDAGQILDNPQVRMIAGQDAMRGACNGATFSRALENVAQNFSFIACAEQADEFIGTLLGFFHLPPVAYVRSQVTGLNRVPSPHPALRDRIQAYHAFDHQLVSWVRDRWIAWASKNLVRQPAAPSTEAILVVGPDFAATRQAGSAARSDLSTEQEDDVLVPQLAKE